MPKKVLIVDSDHLFLEESSRYLTEAVLATEVIISSDGWEALKKIRREHPDLIIVDDSLASIDGYKLTRLIKFDKRYQAIPLILLGQHIDEQNQALAKEVGADDFISRFAPNDIIEKVKSRLKV